MTQTGAGSTRRRSGLVMAAVAAAVVVITVGLFPGDCMVMTTITEGPTSMTTETRCKTVVGLVWPGLALGASAVAILDVLAMAAGFAVIRSSKKKDPA